MVERPVRFGYGGKPTAARCRLGIEEAELLSGTRPGVLEFPL